MTSQTFEVAEEHLKLISKMYIGHDEDTEFGAPEVKPKRPYGNSDVYSDIAEILDEIPDDEDWEGPGPEDRERYEKLHRETATVLQIMISCQSMGSIVVPGTYQVRDKYSIDWVKWA